MKILWIPLSLVLLLTILLKGCSKDSGIGQFDAAVIENSSNPDKFKQLTFILSLQDKEYGYLNLGIIDSVKVYVNAKYWGTFSSEPVDTIHKTDRTANQLKYADEAIGYLFIAPYQLQADNLETAGDFINYLNDRIVLAPGGYVFEVRAIKYRNLEGTWITNSMQLFSNFNVIENTASAYVGNFTVGID